MTELTCVRTKHFSVGKINNNLNGIINGVKPLQSIGYTLVVIVESFSPYFLMVFSLHSGNGRISRLARQLTTRCLLFSGVIFLQWMRSCLRLFMQINSHSCKLVRSIVVNFTFYLFSLFLSYQREGAGSKRNAATTEYWRNYWLCVCLRRDFQLVLHKNLYLAFLCKTKTSNYDFRALSTQIEKKNHWNACKGMKSLRNRSRLFFLTLNFSLPNTCSVIWKLKMETIKMCKFSLIRWFSVEVLVLPWHLPSTFYYLTKFASTSTMFQSVAHTSPINGNWMKTTLGINRSGGRRKRTTE